MEKLPRIVEPWEIIGKLTASAARDCGLLEGTASVFAICIDRYVPDIEHKTLFTARLVPPDLWYALAYINGGGLNLRWFRDELAREEKTQAEVSGRDVYALLDQAAAKVPAGSDSLLFLPHLGGRVCPSDADIRGLWLGFTWRHRKPHLYRAMLEVVAYEYAFYLGIEKALLPDLGFSEARVIGGVPPAISGIRSRPMYWASPTCS